MNTIFNAKEIANVTQALINVLEKVGVPISIFAKFRKAQTHNASIHYNASGSVYAIKDIA